MRMGCGSSKKILSETPSECIVKPIFLPEGSRETRWSGHKNNVKRKLTEKGVRGAKFRARFDIRVTEKYAIKALIGKGAFSRVVRVEHKATKQPYAIKMMEVREGKEVFESELAVLRKVQHAYIVRLYEVFECKDKVYLVMELATGGELFDRIVSRGCFTEQDGTHVLHMVLEGVRYLHSLGITHRDLKPENLLYYHPGNDSKIMITDFGLSKLRKSPDDSTMDTTCGTPDYIAPEILMRRSYTNAVDMWSIGVISYVLLCGALPFADDNSTRLYRAIMKAKYSYKCEPWNDVSDMAKAFIDKLLVVEPEKRMTAEEGLKHQWITSFAASSSFKNLHGSISSNWLKSSSRLNSANSSQSKRSSRSSRSGKSALSRHRKTIPSQTSTLQHHFDMRAKASQDNSKPKNLNVKLTKQVVEKLQADAELPLIIERTSKRTSKPESSTDRQKRIHSNFVDENETQCELQNPVSRCMKFKDLAEREGSVLETIDEPMPDAEDTKTLSAFPHQEQMNSRSCAIQKSFQFADLRHTRLSNLFERDEKTTNGGYKPDVIDGTTFPSHFCPQRQTSLTNNFLNGCPAPPKPFAMDVDDSNEEVASYGSSTVTTNLALPARFRTIMSPNAKRNKVSCSLTDHSI